MNRTRFPGQAWFRAIAWTAFAFLYLPIVVLIFFSVNGGRLLYQWDGFSLRWYAKAFGNQGFRDAALNTMVVSTSATVLATTLAVGAGLYLNAAREREAGWAMLLLGLPLVVPEVVMAIATMIFFSRIGFLDLGIGNLVIGHTAFCIPFALMPIRACLKGIDRSLQLAASDLYAHPWQRVSHVTLPLLAPGIASGAALAFIVSFDDFAMSQFLAGPGQTTLPVFIWAQLKRPLTPEINAMCAIVLIVSVTLICLITAMLSRSGRRLV